MKEITVYLKIADQTFPGQEVSRTFTAKNEDSSIIAECSTDGILLIKEKEKDSEEEKFLAAYNKDAWRSVLTIK